MATEPACLLIADISGYTRYLAGVEIDHAQDILADLMGTIVNSLRPGYRLAKLEGDAAFMHAIAERIDGSLLLDSIERCYFGFRRRRRACPSCSPARLPTARRTTSSSRSCPARDRTGSWPASRRDPDGRPVCLDRWDRGPDPQPGVTPATHVAARWPWNADRRCPRTGPRPTR